jgi:hypothetical protein
VLRLSIDEPRFPNASPQLEEIALADQSISEHFLRDLRLQIARTKGDKDRHCGAFRTRESVRSPKV